MQMLMRETFGFLNGEQENARRGVKACAPENAVRVTWTQTLMRTGKSIKGGKNRWQSRKRSE